MFAVTSEDNFSFFQPYLRNKSLYAPIIQAETILGQIFVWLIPKLKAEITMQSIHKSAWLYVIQQLLLYSSHYKPYLFYPDSLQRHPDLPPQ